MQDFKQSGGCQCGQVRYTLRQEPLVIYRCPGTDCQTQSASAFGISVRVQRAALTFSGTLNSFEKGGAERQFCPTCGTRLLHRRPGYQNTLNFKGGTFDDTSWIMPAGDIWTGSKRSWVLLPEGAVTYDEQADKSNARIAA